MTIAVETHYRLASLTEHLDGSVAFPDHPSWDAARQAYNLAVDQQPAAVGPRDAPTSRRSTATRPATACGSPRSAPATTPRPSARWTDDDPAQDGPRCDA